MAATKSAGRVSIRVLPDSTRFKEDLKRSLERIEKSMQVKIPVELELARAELAKLKRQIESLIIKIRPTIELNIPASDIAALKAQIEAMKPKVVVQLDTARAASRMATLSRTRDVEFRPKLNNAAVAVFMAKLRALSGLNVISDSFREGSEFFLNIDRNAVKYAGLLTKMGTMVALIGSGVGALVVMGAQLASMANIGILAPAFITGLGIGIAVLTVSLKDMKTVLADLGPRFTALQDSISANFWKQAEAPIRSLVDNLFPTLKRQLDETGTQMGGLFGQFAASLEKHATPERVQKMFERMNEAIGISKGAIDPLTSAFVNLGEHGSKYFERFSRWIVSLSERFDRFIGAAAADGRLDKWTEDAIQGFKDLGNMMRGTARIFASINRAAKAAGSMDFGDFADGLNKAADVMNSPRFQQTMTTLFQGMNSAVAGIGRGLRELGPAIESAAPSIKRMLETVGVIAEQVGGILADIIENPKLQAGMESFLGSIAVSLDKLKPAAQPFADSLGGILDLMGRVLIAVSELGAKILIEWGPVFDKMGEKLAELIDPLSNSLKNFVEKMTPVWESFYNNVLVKVVDMIEDKVLPALDKIVNSAAPELDRAFKEVGRLLDEVVNPALDWLLEQLDLAITKKGEFQSIFDLPKLADPKNFGWKGGWAVEPGNFEIDRDRLNGMLAPLNDSVNQALEDFWGDVGRNNEGMMQDWGKNTEGMFLDLAAGWDGMWKDFFRGIGEAAEREWNKFWGGFEGWWEDRKKDFQKKFKELFGFGGSGEDEKPAEISGSTMGGKGRGVGAVIMPATIDEEAEKSWIDTFNTEVNTKLGEFWTGLGEKIAEWTEPFTTGWNEFWGGLGTKVQETWDGMLLWIDTKKTEIKTSVDTWIEEVKVGWTTFWDGLGTKVQEAWNGFLAWIDLKKAEIKTSIDTWISEVQTNWNNFWTTVGTFLQTKWDEMVNWVRTKAQEIKTNIDTFISEVKTNWDNFWRTVGEKLRTAWDEMVQTIRTKTDEAVQWVKDLPGKAKTALDNAAGDLRSSGKNLIQGFINGMGDLLQSAKNKAAEIVQAVKDFFPHSPAKVGPFSGTGYTPYSGRALVKDFADGMMSNMSKVREATKAVAEAAHLGSHVDLETDLDQDGVVIDRSSTTLKVYYPVAEPTSRTIEKSANTLRMAKAL